MRNIEKLQFAEAIAKEGREPEEGLREEVARQILDIAEEQFALRTELGKGRAAEVWMGEIATLKEICIKTIHNPDISPNSLEREFKLQEKAAQAGVRTAQPLAYVEGSSDTGDISQVLAMETLKGRDLKEQMKWMHKNEKKFTREEYKSIIAQIKEQVSIAHSANLYHRDLHLGNIFLGEDGTVSLIDWGHATDASGIHDEDEIYRQRVSKGGREIMEVYPRDEDAVRKFNLEIKDYDLLDKST